MTKRSNNNFLSLIKDEEFIKLVKSSENTDDLLIELKQKYTGNKKSLLYAIEFIQANLSDKIKLNTEDYDLILNNIVEYSDNKKKKGHRIIMINNLWRAAVVLIILSIGTLVIYDQVDKDPLEKFAQTEIEESEKGMIVLSDGTQRLLKNNDSYIEYNTEEGDIIVKNANEESERIINPDNQTVLNQIIVPYGQTHTVALSDGTIVQLNAGSKLTFPAEFKGKTRDVFLKGEGFFQVNKNEEKPFHVKTEYIDVEVLGTKFNISAYSDEKLVTTVLLEGKVKVSQKNRIFKNNEFIIKPGEGCFYTISNEKSVIKNVDIECYTSWTDGWITFKEMPLLDIVRRLKKYYNKPIGIDGEILANTLVSGKLVLSGSFDEVLQSLSFTIEGTYQISPNGEYIIKN